MSNNFEVALVFKAVDETAKTFTATIKGLDKVAGKTQDMMGAASGAGGALSKSMVQAGAATAKVGSQVQAAGVLAAGAAGAARKLGTEAEAAGGRAAGGFRKPAKVLDELRQKAQGVTDALRNAGLGTAAAGVAMAASIYKPIQAYAEMESVMTQARLPYMGAHGTDPIWAEIQPIIERLGQDLPGTSADFGEIAGSMRSAGLAARDIRDGGLEAAAALKILGRMNNEEAGFLSVQMSRALKVGGHDFKAFADELQRTSFAAGISIREMATAIPYMGSQLQLFKISGLPGAQAVTTAMAMLKDAGVSGTELGTSLAGLMDRLPILQDRLLYGRGWKTREGAGLLQRYNLGNLGTQLFDEKGELRGDTGLTKMANVVTVFDRINRSITSTKDRAFLFDELLGDIGKRAGVAFTIENWNAARKKILDQADLQTRLNEVLKTQASLWEALTGTGKIFLASVAEPLAPVIKGITRGLNTLTGHLVDWNRAHPKLTAAIAGTVVVGGGLALLVGGLMLSIALLGKVLLATTRGFGDWDRFLVLSRIAVRGLGNDALGASAKMGLLGRGKGLLAGSLPGLLGAPGKGLGMLLKVAILAPLKGIGAAIAGVVGGITWPVALAVAAVAALVYVYWEPIKAFFKGFGSGFVSDFKPVLTVLGTLVDALGSIFRALGGLGEILGLVQAGSDGVNASFGAGAKVGSFFAGVVHLVAIFFQWVAQGAEAVTLAVVTLVDVLATAANSISNLLQGKFSLAKGNWSGFSERFWGRLENSSFKAASAPIGMASDAARVGQGEAPSRISPGTGRLGAPLSQDMMKALLEGRAPAGGVQVNYNPKIEMPPGATRDDAAWLMRVLDQHKEEVAGLVTKVYERQGRWNGGGNR
jgi:TP901 family phage tail tape measure protein